MVCSSSSRLGGADDQELEVVLRYTVNLRSACKMRLSTKNKQTTISQDYCLREDGNTPRKDLTCVSFLPEPGRGTYHSCPRCTGEKSSGLRDLQKSWECSP